MLFTFSLVVTIAELLRQSRLVDQFKQSMVLVGRSRIVQIKLEVDEEVVILHLTELEQTYVLFLLLIDLHVAIMSHYPLVKL